MVRGKGEEKTHTQTVNLMQIELKSQKKKNLEKHDFPFPVLFPFFFTAIYMHTCQKASSFPITGRY